MIRRTMAVGVAVFALAACAKGSDTKTDSTAMMAPADTAAAMKAPAPATPAKSALLNPNDATREQLVQVPGLDSGTVTAIVKARPYKTMLDVDKVLAKKPEKERDSIYTRIFVPIDINKASRKEVELIPGVGPKMSHEFEEYRPWTSVEQFRKEIGKYVDAEEVARLERYIVIH